MQIKKRYWGPNQQQQKLIYKTKDRIMAGLVDLVVGMIILNDNLISS